MLKIDIIERIMRIPQQTEETLSDIFGVLQGVEDIGICTLSAADVVRHRVVQKIRNAYEKAEQKKVEGKPAPKTNYRGYKR